jgi:hypothetical protein
MCPDGAKAPFEKIRLPRVELPVPENTTTPEKS